MPGGKIDILVEPDLKQFPSKLGAGLRAAGSVASVAGKAIGVALTAGTVAAAAGLTKIIDLGIDYQNSLNTLQAVTGATAEQMAAAGQRATELGSDLSLPATSAADAAVAMAELAKGGLSVDQAMSAAKGTLQLAAAAQISAAQAAEIQSNALNTFNLSADKAGMVADVLAGAANAASGEITDFASAFQAGGSVAAQFGISIGDTATALALLANNGIQGSDAGTLLKSTLLALTDTSKPAQAAIKQLGLTVYNAQGQFVGLPSLIDQLGAASKRMTPEQYAAATATLFGSDAIRFAGVAAKTTASDWQTLEAQVTKTGNAQELAAAKAKGVGGALDSIKSQLETIGLSIFSVIAQPLEDGLRVIAQFLSDASGQIQGFISSGGLQAFLDGALAKIKAFGQSIGVTWDGIVAFFTGAGQKIATVAQNIGTFLAPIGEGLGKIFDSFRSSGGLFDIAVTALGGLVDGFVALTGVLAPIGNVIGTVLGLFAQLPAPVQAFVLGMLAFKGLPALADALGTSIGKLLTTSGPLGTVLGSAIDGVIGGFSRAGTAAKNSVSGLRQFSDEMRLQKALAEQAGQSISTYEAAQAAFETSTVGSVEALRELRDSFTSIKDGAEAAGDPMSNLEAAIRALGEQNGTIGDLVASFDAGGEAGQAFGEKVSAAAERAAQSLSDKLVNATNKAADGIRSIPGKISDVGGAIADAFRAGVEFISQIPEKAAAAGEAVTSGLGSAFQSAADFVGEFGGQIQQALAAAGPAARAAASAVGSALRTGFTTAFTSAIGAVRTFATGVSTAFTGIVTAVAGVPARITGALAAIRTGFTSLPTVIGGALTSIRTGISTFGTALQTGLVGAFRAIPGIVAGATGSLTTFASRVGSIGATVGAGLTKGIGSAIGGLVNILGGPLGVALLAAQFGLQALAKSQQQAAQAAADHQARIQGLKGTLDQYTGSVTAATVAEQAKDIAARKLSDGTTSFATALRGAGIDLRDFTEAASGNQEKLQLVNSQLFIAAQRTPALQALYAQWKPRLDEAGVSMETFTAAAIGNSGAFDELTTKLGVSGSGLEIWRQDLAKAVGPVGELGSALGQYNKEVQEASEQQRIAGQATKDFGAILDSLKIGFGGLKDGGQATAVLAAGFNDLAETAGNAATRTGQAAEKIGGVKAGADAAAQSMQKSRDQFIEAATAAGLTAEQAAALADQIGLIPTAARINFETNATGVNAELITIGEQVKAVPDAKTVTVNTLSADAEAKLKSFGLEVTHLPNGQAVIDLKDQAARDAFQAFVASIASQTVPVQAQAVVDAAEAAFALLARARVGMITGVPIVGVAEAALQLAARARDSQITGVPNTGAAEGNLNNTARPRPSTVTAVPNTGAAESALNNVARARTATVFVNVVTTGSAVAHAAGGIVSPMHDGGVVGMAHGGNLARKRLTPMRSGIATIVAPNTWRIIGDRLRDDEAFIPINTSARSRAILAMTAERMGYALARRYADGGFASSGLDRARSVAARSLTNSGVDVAPIAAQLAQLRSDLTQVRREVAINNNFFTEPSARDSDSVAATQRRQAALGLFG